MIMKARTHDLFILFLCIWVIIFFWPIFNITYLPKASLLIANIELFIYFYMIYIAIEFNKHLGIADKRVFKWLTISSIALFVKNLSYYILFDIYQLTLPIIWHIYFNITLGCWLYACTVLFLKILMQNIMKISLFLKIISVLLLMNLIIIAIFDVSLTWTINRFYFLGVYEISKAFFALMVFDVAILCLIFSKEIGVQFFISGIIVSIAGDFWNTSHFIENTLNVQIYGELCWFLGATLICLGIVFLKANQSFTVSNWFKNIGSIRSRLVLWTFNVAIVSFFIFFTFAYLFQIIKSSFLSNLPFFAITYSVIVVLLSLFVGKYFETPFNKIIKNIQSIKFNQQSVVKDTDFSIVEFSILQSFIMDTLKLREEKIATQKNLELIAIATQVAHDIRSPLTALNAIVKTAHQLPEKQRTMINNATQRINDIANNMLLSYPKEGVPTASLSSPQLSSEPLSVILDAVISEKRAEYQHLAIGITLQVTEDAYGLFVNINTTHFKSVISNLINNAVEAVQNTGQIIVELRNTADKAIINIVDNGVGMSENLLQKILCGAHGVSSKETGHGIGVHSSRQFVESWQGKFSISSKLNVGTSVTITLPQQQPACWFASRLEFCHGATIIILDDEQSIHDIWLARFTNEFPAVDFKFVHFYTPDHILQYNAQKKEHTYYLCDYQLIEQQLTGLDVIEKLKVAPQSTLVTSRYEDSIIRQRCGKLGVKILPKTYVPYTPIDCVSAPEITTTSKCTDFIVIDDDALLTDSWSLIASTKNKTITVFNTISAAEQSIYQYDINIPIYIDSELGEPIKGEIYAKRLFKHGFTTIFLISGHKITDFPHMYWIKAVVSKDPEFWLMAK